MFLRLLYSEIYKIFRKWRTYISFGAVGFLIIVIQLAVYYEGNYYLRQLTKNLQDNFMFVGNLLNGWLVSYFIMQFFYVHVPFLIVVVTGDIMAGEGSAGTYRFLLIRPVNRFEVVLSKYLSGLVYTFLFVIFFGGLSIILGLSVFGGGELLTFNQNFVIFARDDVLWRFIFSLLSAFVAMSVIASISFLFSSLVQNSIGPIIGTMVILISFLIITEMKFDFIQPVIPYLFTSHMTVWQDFFNDPVDWSKVVNSIQVLITYSASVFLITYLIFRKKDILT